MGLGGGMDWNAIVSDGTCVQWIATILKVLIVVIGAVNIPPIMVWLERRAPALMQRRRGPNRVGFFGLRLWGLLQSLADAIKLIFKEEAPPDGAAKWFYHLGPIFSLFPALMVLGCISFGPDITVLGVQIPLQVIRVQMGFLFILAMSGMGIYGVVLAGWAANNKFSLLGSLRASAQMVSYEIPMGLSLVPIVLIYDSLDLLNIIEAQGAIWRWGIFLAPVSFMIFLVTMFAETNRVPFDLAEGESELVAGFHTEFGSAKFALFFLSEYVNMFALSCLCASLFFGGWQIPFISMAKLAHFLGSSNLAALCGVLCLLLKAAFFMWLFVWVRWTIPRFRYDQLMQLGWKFLMPVGLVNIVLTALVLSLLF